MRLARRKTTAGRGSLPSHASAFGAALLHFALGAALVAVVASASAPAPSTLDLALAPSPSAPSRGGATTAPSRAHALTRTDSAAAVAASASTARIEATRLASAAPAGPQHRGAFAGNHAAVLAAAYAADLLALRDRLSPAPRGHAAFPPLASARSARGPPAHLA